MSGSHRANIEKTLGNKRNQLQQEHDEDIDDLDVVEFDNEFKNDSQYKELLASMPARNQPRSKSKAIEDLPKYQGKKVSRKEMNAQDEEEDDEDEEEEGSDIKSKDLLISSDEEEEEDEEEEDDDDDDGEDESLGDDDEEEEEGDDNSNSDQDEEKIILDDEEEEFEQLKKITKQIQEQKKKRVLHQDELHVDQIIDEINDEDNENAPELKKQRDDEASKAKSVRQQIQLWKELVFTRFNMHKSLEQLKRFPGVEDIGGFGTTPASKKTAKYLELNILRNIDLLQHIRSNLYNKCNIGSASKSTHKSIVKSLQKFVDAKQLDSKDYELNKRVNIEKLWKETDESFVSTHSWMEDSILRWSEKTQLLNSINLKRSGMGALVHTPIGQTTKAMNQVDMLIYKSQLKRSAFRILGKELSNLQKETDEQIYDDSDLYHELLKNYMAEIEQNNTLAEDGLLFDSTRLHLLERKLKQQEKAISNVDRKASKSRKIRFDVHQKLVNFMNPIDNKDLLEGRNEIIKCLLGKAVEETEEKADEATTEATTEPVVTKKRKLNSKKAPEMEEEEGFALI